MTKILKKKMNWSESFGVDKIPENSNNVLKHLCYPKMKEDSNKPKFKLLIDKKKFYCAQINGIYANETNIINLIDADPSIGTYLVDFLAYERNFRQNLLLLENEIFPLMKENIYENISNRISKHFSDLKDAHIVFLSQIETLFAQMNFKHQKTNQIIDSFISILCGNPAVLKSHQDYMNKFLEIEQIANAFSVEFSEKFYNNFGNKTIIQMLKMPLTWQHYTEDFARKLSQMVSETNASKVEMINGFADELKALTESIDCIPQLEALSKLFVTEPFPIVVSGRRILRRGSAFKHCRSNITKREIFLFSDIFMYAQLNCGHYLAPADYLLTKLRVEKQIAEKPLLAFYAPKKSFILQFNDDAERDAWFTVIDDAINNALEANGGKRENYREAPIWVADSAVSNCMNCGKPFNPITRRRHHCRICGKVLCGECVTNKMIIPNISTTKPEKVCDHCYAEFSKQTNNA